MPDELSLLWAQPPRRLDMDDITLAGRSIRRPTEPVLGQAPPPSAGERLATWLTSWGMPRWQAERIGALVPLTPPGAAYDAGQTIGAGIESGSPTQVGLGIGSATLAALGLLPTSLVRPTIASRIMDETGLAMRAPSAVTGGMPVPYGAYGVSFAPIAHSSTGLLARHPQAFRPEGARLQLMQDMVGSGITPADMGFVGPSAPANINLLLRPANLNLPIRLIRPPPG